MKFKCTNFYSYFEHIGSRGNQKKQLRLNSLTIVSPKIGRDTVQILAWDVTVAWPNLLKRIDFIGLWIASKCITLKNSTQTDSSLNLDVDEPTVVVPRIPVPLSPQSSSQTTDHSHNTRSIKVMKC